MMLFLIFLLAICGSFIQRVSGFGFGVFVMMFLPFLIPHLGEAATVSGLLAGTMSLLVVVRHWKDIQWKTIWLLLLSNIVISYLAIRYMAGMGNDTLKLILGILLILIALFSLTNHYLQGRRHVAEKTHPMKHQHLYQVLAGSISGVTGGMFGMPGPPDVIYCIEAIKQKEAYVATLQAIFLCSNIFYTLFRAQAGFFTSHTFLYWGVGLLGVVIGTVLGAKLFDKISGNRLRQIVYLLMLASGIVTLF